MKKVYFSDRRRTSPVETERGRERVESSVCRPPEETCCSMPAASVFLKLRNPRAHVPDAPSCARSKSSPLPRTWQARWECLLWRYAAFDEGKKKEEPTAVNLERQLTLNANVAKPGHGPRAHR